MIEENDMFKYSLVIAGIVSPLVISGCVAADGASTKSSHSRGGLVIPISQEIKAEIRRQGHDPDEKVCVRQTPSGSTIPVQTCASRAAWEAKRQASRQSVEDAQRNSLRTRDPGAGG
jgi:hypothetical protein